MDAHTRRLVGWVLAALGLVVAVVGGLADQLGLGGEGPDEFGRQQVAAVAVGVVLIVVGLALALWRPGRHEPGDGGMAEPPG